MKLCRHKDLKMLSYRDIVDSYDRNDKSSDDFEVMMNFISENCKKSYVQNSHSNKKQSMFKAFANGLTLTEKKPRKSQKSYDGRIVVINGIPE